ncbi:MAG: DUF692 domain-containing protein [Candidatus Azotimanducaceae bacterium]
MASHCDKNVEKSVDLSGAGLGLRREMMSEMSVEVPPVIDFFELAPENWIGIGGRLGRQLEGLAEQRPIVCHGLSLSIGGPSPIDRSLVADIKKFIAKHRVRIYSEHLSYTSDGGQLYDLLPMPHTDEAVRHIASRVKEVQDILEQKIALENVSYYLTPKACMDEVSFITAVLEEADCDLLLDVNNVYVNSINHSYDALDFIKKMPSDRVVYLHVAGHFEDSDGVIIDTHGSPVVHSVWDLLEQTYAVVGVKPTLLERDFNIPATDILLAEIKAVRQRQEKVVDHNNQCLN